MSAINYEELEEALPNSEESATPRVSEVEPPEPESDPELIKVSGPYKPKKKIFTLKRALVAAVVITAAGSYFLFDSADIENFVGKFPTLQNGEVKNTLFNTKLEELSRQKDEQISTINGQLNNMQGALKSVGSVSEQAATALNMASQNQQALMIINSKLTQISMDLARLSDVKKQAPVMNVGKDYGADISDIKGRMSDIIFSLSKVTNAVKENGKDISSLDDRHMLMKAELEQKAMDEQRIAEAKSKTPAVTIKVPWVNKAANYDKKVAVLVSPVTHKKVTVVVGTDVPQCGRVLDMIEESKTIVTEQCSIAKG